MAASGNILEVTLGRVIFDSEDVVAWVARRLALQRGIHYPGSTLASARLFPGGKIINIITENNSQQLSRKYILNSIYTLCQICARGNHVLVDSVWTSR